ncbi:Protein GLT-5 [Aphelenchoides avenae]|nr:Protein GLT-5 [Aphelenchus avenae]
MAGKRSAVFRENLLLILTVASVFVGGAIGLLVRMANPSSHTIELIGFPGEILMNMLKMVILPLIAASLISGLSQLDARQSGRIGAFAFTYYAMTTTLAVITGIILVLIIHPGDPSIKQQVAVQEQDQASVSAVDKMLDLVRNMFPANIIEASFRQTQTDYRNETQFSFVNGPNATAVTVEKAKHNMVDGMNILGLIVFFITMGIVMSFVGAPAKPLIDLFVALDIVITKIVGLIMWYSPIGIASLIAMNILEISDLARTARMLGLYMTTVIVGLIMHLFITIPIIYFLACRKNPYVYMKGLLQAALTALGTASSAASLPVTFKCLENNNGVAPMYTKFVLPVGATINMDGTALYEAVASIFIAQMNGIELGIGQVITVTLTATLASVGAASIPSAGLVTMLIVLTAVGLPSSDIAMIVAVDWLLDRLRTCVNVMGDGFGCGFVQAMVERKGRISAATSSDNSNGFLVKEGLGSNDLTTTNGDSKQPASPISISIESV